MELARQSIVGFVFQTMSGVEFQTWSVFQTKSKFSLALNIYIYPKLGIHVRREREEIEKVIIGLWNEGVISISEEKEEEAKGNGEGTNIRTRTIMS